MKILKLAVILLLLTSCKETTAEKTLVILYQDGTREELTIRDKGYNPNINIVFKGDCLYRRYEQHLSRMTTEVCLRCGVKNYRVIRQDG